VISSVVTHSAACFDFRRPIAMLVKTSQTFPRSRVLDDYYHGLLEDLLEAYRNASA
jgi:hypothetical protein